MSETEARLTRDLEAALRRAEVAENCLEELREIDLRELRAERDSLRAENARLREAVAK